MCSRARARARYRRRKTYQTIFLRAVVRYPADCLQRTFLSRATNKNASPTDIEKSLGGITAEIRAGYPDARGVRACAHELDTRSRRATSFQLFFVIVPFSRNRSRLANSWE